MQGATGVEPQVVILRAVSAIRQHFSQSTHVTVDSEPGGGGGGGRVPGGGGGGHWPVMVSMDVITDVPPGGGGGHSPVIVDHSVTVPPGTVPGGGAAAVMVMVEVPPGGAGGQLPSVGLTGVAVVQSDQVLRATRGLAVARRLKPEEMRAVERMRPIVRCWRPKFGKDEWWQKMAEEEATWLQVSWESSYTVDRPASSSCDLAEHVTRVHNMRDSHRATNMFLQFVLHIVRH